MAKADRWGPHPCSIEGCSERRVSRGLCSLHYARLLCLGDPWVQSVRTEDRPDLLSVRRPGFARYQGSSSFATELPVCDPIERATGIGITGLESARVMAG